ncbi:nitroreductase family protein [Paenibacillus cymbidii]|uniref:nitroreductase family protein n=1 Tax=Paenibacillus cymbidii TaxID=1639034 RepID=UPI00108205EA|nr:nitroreductase family protein [Paenibacillus cymbidii]
MPTSQPTSVAKAAETVNHRTADFDIAALFLNRWSPRAFSGQEVSEELLMSVLEAARWAPSGSNEQPWRFIVARTPEQRERFHSFINEFNLAWCHKAPVLIVVGSEKMSSTGKPSPSHAFDAGTAWGYLALQAMINGLVSHAMGGFDKTKARETLRVPDSIELHAVVALGYQGDRDELPERYREREQPNSRKPLQETIVMGSFPVNS